jgi:hypothetical protein
MKPASVRRRPDSVKAGDSEPRFAAGSEMMERAWVPGASRPRLDLELASRRIETADDVIDAIALMRLNYDGVVNRHGLAV